MKKTTHRIYLLFLYLSGIIIIGWAAIPGFTYYGLSAEAKNTRIEMFEKYEFSYYGLPIENRNDDPMHKELRPSGVFGHGFGIVGSAMMIIGVLMYMVRKRFKSLARLGILKHWLEFHIFLCSVGPMLILLHTAMKFGGIVAVSFWSMVAVVASGVIGRFIYIQIPRTIQGNVCSLDDLDQQNNELAIKLRQDYGVDEGILVRLDALISLEYYRSFNLFSILRLTISDFFVKNHILSEIKNSLIEQKVSHENLKEVLKICKAKITLGRRIGILSGIQKMFRYWHIVHLPFALVMLIIMFIHVGVAYAFGYRWIF